MDFVILHNGEDISNELNVSRCFSDDRYGGMLDDLTIAFATKGHTIEFYENDKIEIKTNGGFSTGAMNLDSCIGNDGVFTIKALSCRHKNKKKKSKIWNKAKLTEIIKDAASNSGLTPLLYGIKDYTYIGVAQINETDLHLLSRLCKREGYSVKCDNGNLIVFNEYYLEKNSTPIQISKSSVGSNYYFERSTDGLSSMTVRYYNPDSRQTISYTATDKNIDGGEDTKIEFLQDISEAERFAIGYLRDSNKFYIKGILDLPFNENISAGTVTDLTDFEEFDGRYVIYEARQDFVGERTIIKVRKSLSY